MPEADADVIAPSAAAEIRRRREAIDDLDGRIIGLLEERRRTSSEIQQIRKGSGGAGLDRSREEIVLARYGDALADEGRHVASAVLSLCRGQLPQPGPSAA
ncbi:chorismate mutase [Streptomyces pinistramenti]|uniref:chorismate mutase n=1 Tax=Streptomyces pinistramenti TaxID=2884812 RepID=UPI001D07431B|nr:chorismate mutase [Streptomyces pinistramenti]MCB5908048.1 chorismate mutase [Streptomyces pinistramenti]